MTKTKKISKTSDTSIEQKSTLSCWVNPSVPVMRCWKVLPSLRCSVMVSPGHNTGVETFQEQIKLYELWITHEAASEPVQAVYGSLLLFFLASPHFSPFLMFPWKCAERFFKSETLLIIWSSTTVTAQQLAVGECWAGLGPGCWVELETKVREGFIVTLKDPTRAFTFRPALKICLDAMFRCPFSLLPCEECSTRASSGHCENFADLCFQL